LELLGRLVGQLAITVQYAHITRAFRIMVLWVSAKSVQCMYINFAE